MTYPPEPGPGFDPQTPPPYEQTPYPQAPYASGAEPPTGYPPTGGYPAAYPQAPYPQAPYPGGGYGNPYAVQATNGFAIAALVCSFFSVIGGLLGVIFGCVALNQIKQRGGQGKGMAIAGIVIGSCWLAFVVIAIVFGIIAAATDS
jgi:Domain of unknown function (DUF4190)